MILQHHRLRCSIRYSSLLFLPFLGSDSEQWHFLLSQHIFISSRCWFLLCSDQWVSEFPCIPVETVDIHGVPAIVCRCTSSFLFLFGRKREGLQPVKPRLWGLTSVHLENTVLRVVLTLYKRRKHHRLDHEGNQWVLASLLSSTSWLLHEWLVSLRQISWYICMLTYFEQILFQVSVSINASYSSLFC